MLKARSHVCSHLGFRRACRRMHCARQSGFLSARQSGFLGRYAALQIKTSKFLLKARQID
jgi:hypothetical protein